jgi:hypothetical protein
LAKQVKLMSTDVATKDRFFNMRVDDDFIEMVDDIRSSQRPMLDRTACIKSLVAERHAQVKRIKK